MKVQITEKSDNELKFVLEESNPQFANALRRIIISEIPVLAVEDVDLTINDSVLYNEVLAHRLGMIPLVFNPKDFNFRDNCVCKGKGCSQCEVVFAINKKGSGMVYSKDMKSSNSDVKPLYDNIPIVELFDEQKIKLEAIARLGTGRNHARFKAANAAYQYSEDPTKFTFNIESVSCLKPEEIVMLAADVLKNKAKEFAKEIKK